MDMLFLQAVLLVPLTLLLILTPAGNAPAFAAAVDRRSRLHSH